jgi:hypothetical protein
VDLLAVEWRDGVLAGRSRLVGGDPYDVYLTEPAGWRLAEMRCEGAAPLPVERPRAGAPVVRAGCRVDSSGEVSWQARFEPRAPAPRASVGR